MLLCGCGRWMHTDGVEEQPDGQGVERWLVRARCGGCGLTVGIEGTHEEVVGCVDRRLWSDDARHVLDRMPPYLSSLYKEEIEDYARRTERKVITWGFLAEARRGGVVDWDPEAERRLQNVPAAVRGMARTELERTAAEQGLARVTVALMDEVKARYFGLTAGQGR